MSYWYKIKTVLRRFMQGRNGSDELSFTLLVCALVCSLLSTFTGSVVLHLLSLVSYFLCIYRMLSRKIEKRYAENQRYLSAKAKIRLSAKQSWTRLRNIKKYRYFKCPQCHSLLRLPRKVGEVTVTCGKCHHAFKQKA